MEDKVKELTAQVQQAKDEKFELEMEISDLKKKLTQQEEKYDHDMDMISKVCSRSALKCKNNFCTYVVYS